MGIPILYLCSWELLHVERMMWGLARFLVTLSFPTSFHSYPRAFTHPRKNFSLASTTPPYHVVFQLVQEAKKSGCILQLVGFRSLLAIWLDKGWDNPDRNVVAKQYAAGERVDFLDNFQSYFLRQYRDERHSQHLQSLVAFKNFQSHFSRQYRDWRHSQHFQSLVVFNRISRANIVASDTRNMSKAWSTSKKSQWHFSRQYRD